MSGEQITLGFEQMVESTAEKMLLSAKRSLTERSGVHAWHPYYAGYSERFVESALEFLGCDHETLIFDPWGGSGTTGMVASKNGSPALCLDINPVMATFAAAKSYTVLAHAEDIEDFFFSLSRKLPSDNNLLEKESITKIFVPESASLIRSVIESIPGTAHLDEGIDKIDAQVLDACRDPNQLINPIYAFCMAVIFVTIRRLSGTVTMANPTWLRTNDIKVCIDKTEFFSEVRISANNMLMDLRDFFRGRNISASNYAIAGDSRAMPIKEAAVDVIITSPPYLTRIDYAVSTMPELYLFGGDDLLTFVRHQTMGAPVITKREKEQKKEWGTLCNKVLDAIRMHGTKAAESYYWKNIVQYFMDLDAALTESYRVLKAGGKGLIVVQSSYFKDIEIPLGEIYQEMASIKGFVSQISFREEVKGHMAHVNTRSNIYKHNRFITKTLYM